MEPTTIIIRPVDVTSSLKRELTIKLPASSGVLEVLAVADKAYETLEFVAQPDNGKTLAAWDVSAMLDTLVLIFDQYEYLRLMSCQNCQPPRPLSHEQLDAAHQSIYVFLELHGYKFFLQEDYYASAENGRWAKTQTEVAQFAPDYKWNAARKVYQRIRALQQKEEAKATE